MRTPRGSADDDRAQRSSRRAPSRAPAYGSFAPRMMRSGQRSGRATAGWRSVSSPHPSPGSARAATATSVARPTSASLFFPSGMLLDPRADPGRARDATSSWSTATTTSRSTRAPWSAIDLDAFFAEWSLLDDDGEPTYVVDPYCSAERCVQDIGSAFDERASVPTPRAPAPGGRVRRDPVRRQRGAHRRLRHRARRLVQRARRAGARGLCDAAAVAAGPRRSERHLHRRGEPGRHRRAAGLRVRAARGPDGRCDKTHRITHLLDDPRWSRWTASRSTC